MKYIFRVDKEWCSKEKLCCFHVYLFNYNIFGRKDKTWYAFGDWITKAMVKWLIAGFIIGLLTHLI